MQSPMPARFDMEAVANDMEQRRSGIPVPKSKTNTLKKTLSKSNDDLLADTIADVDDQNVELHLFNLMEDKITLEEKTKALSSENNTSE